MELLDYVSALGDMTLHDWLSCCVEMGTTPEEAYKQAVEGIFVQKEEVHRFAMPNQSHKHPDKSRWTLFEMWPINVSLACLHLLI